MRNRSGRGPVSSVLALGGLLALLATPAGAGSWKADDAYTLANIGLSEFLATNIAGLPAVDDHGIDLGGIGSDLWHGPGDGPGVYWMITDRGPNGEDPRTFPVPEFTPFILQVKTTGSGIEILDAIPIIGPGGAADGVTGIPNLDGTGAPPAPNEPFFGCGGMPRLATNSNGLDTEGLVRLRDGTFWIVEEYSPSLLHVAADGSVIRRWFPEGLLAYLATDPDYPSDDAAGGIPGIFGQKRKLNRGFEGITASPNEKTLYLALQSPLRNPSNAAGDASRVTRLLAFDVETETVTAEYAYRFQWTGDGTNDDEFDVPSLGSTGRARARDMKVSALAMLDEHRLLVLERTDFKAKVFGVDLRGATNILGTVWDDVATAPSLETYNADGALEDVGVEPLPKWEVASFDSTQGYPRKIEGLAVLDGKTIAIANDNDFGVGTFLGSSCTLVDSGIESQIVVVRLNTPLK